MSDALTPPAPSDEPATPSVEVLVPGTDGAVGGGSASSPGEEAIPATRFNGLMSSFNKLQTQAQARETELTEQLEALRTENESLRSPQQHSKETPQPVPENADISTLQEQVNQLTQMLVTERLDTAKKAALDAHPEAQPFADLIQADSPEAFEEMARLIADRIKGVTPPASATTDLAAPAAGEAQAPAAAEQTPAAPAAPAAPATPAAPVVGGGTTFDSNASLQDRVSTAIQAGDWSGYLRAKQEAADAQATGSSALVS